MCCPMCGSWASVKETRTNKNENVVTRRYECGNTHRFSTEERIRDEVLRRKLQPGAVLSEQGSAHQDSLSDAPIV